MAFVHEENKALGDFLLLKKQLFSAFRKNPTRKDQEKCRISRSQLHNISRSLSYSRIVLLIFSIIPEDFSKTWRSHSFAHPNSVILWMVLHSKQSKPFLLLRRPPCLFRREVWMFIFR